MASDDPRKVLWLFATPDAINQFLLFRKDAADPCPIEVQEGVPYLLEKFFSNLLRLGDRTIPLASWAAKVRGYLRGTEAWGTISKNYRLIVIHGPDRWQKDHEVILKQLEEGVFLTQVNREKFPLPKGRAQE